MAKRAVRRNIETVDPMFTIPEGVDELVYDEDLSDNINYGEGLHEEDEIIFEDEPEAEKGVPTPKIIKIISQTVRTLKSGDERVDVVIEVEDIKGVDKYEFRVSKKK